MAKTTLMIEISVDDIVGRRILNNLLANTHSEIHNFILNGNTNELSSKPRMGVREYNLEVKITTEP